MIRNVYINADLAPRVWHATSNEETRYYLNGFNVCKAPSRQAGACLAATDGHILSVYYDESGMVDYEGDESPIVALSPAELKACRAKHNGPGFNWLCLTDDGKTLSIVRAESLAEACETHLNKGGEDRLISRTYGQHFIEGHFPDWQRVMTDPANLGETLPDGFNHRLLERLAKGLGEGEARAQPITLKLYGAADHKSRGCPILVRRATGDFCERWFGLVMPMRSKLEGVGAAYPSFASRPATVTPAAESAAPYAVAAE